MISLKDGPGNHAAPHCGLRAEDREARSLSGLQKCEYSGAKLGASLVRLSRVEAPRGAARAIHAAKDSSLQRRCQALQAPRGSPLEKAASRPSASRAGKRHANDGALDGPRTVGMRAVERVLDLHHVGSQLRRLVAQIVARALHQGRVACEVTAESIALAADDFAQQEIKRPFIIGSRRTIRSP